MRTMIHTRNLALFTLLVSTAPAQHWLSAPADLPTGIQQLRLSGDLDLDGDIDFLAVFHGSFIGYLTPWLNDGTGRFTEGARTELPGSAATRVALGDVTGDGRLDFLSAATNGSEVGSGLLVYPGLPGVQFDEPVHTPVPGNIVGLAVGDADGAGAQDVAVLHFNTGSQVDLTWFLAQGDGQFDLSPSTTIGGLTDDIVAIDLDGNGLDDIALSQGDTVSLYLGQSAPTLLASLPVPAFLGAFASSYLDAGDLDADGDPDLAVGSHGFSSTALSVVRNQGGGSWAIEPGLNWTNGQTFKPLIGDWDRDELADVVGWTFQPGLRFFQNQGDGTFALARTAFDVDDGWIQYSSLADLDGDGLLDLHLPRQVLFGDGTFDDPNGGADRATILRDWEGDGDLDLMTTTAHIMLNDGRGVFTSSITLEQPEPPPVTFYQPDMIIADFDQDGRDEFLTALFDDRPYPFRPVFREMRWLARVPGGDLIDVGLAAPTGIPIGSNLARDVDIDGDGDFDIVNRDGMFLFADGFFSGPDLVYPGWSPVGSGDVDGDGDLDLLANRTSGSQHVAVLRQGPALQFTVEELVTSTSTVVYNNLPLLADLDDDGDLDVVINQGPPGLSIRLFENQGGVFSEVLDSGLDRGARGFVATDVDTDGLTDLVVPGSDTLVYRRTGPGLSYEPATSFQARVGGPQKAADIDHDGDADLILGTIVRNRSFFGPDTGGSRQYGAGTVGTGGHTPVLGARGVFRPGESASVTLRDARGPTLGILVVGTSELNGSSMMPGMNLYVGDPVLFWPFLVRGNAGVAGSGKFDLEIDPFLDLLSGLTLYHQVLLLDPGAPRWFTLTNGLELEFGR